MSLLHSIGISRSALQAERLRMDVVANNLANMHSTRTEEGGRRRPSSAPRRALRSRRCWPARRAPGPA
ncbi:MAG: flagellar basal body protein [Dehalococcoidia bacterium]